MNVKSYEMAPTTFQAFWKQRMRWAQGWTQASVSGLPHEQETLSGEKSALKVCVQIRHMSMIWNNPPGGKRQPSERFGILSLLLVREISYYLVTQVSRRPRGMLCLVPY